MCLINYTTRNSDMCLLSHTGVRLCDHLKIAWVAGVRNVEKEKGDFFSRLPHCDKKKMVNPPRCCFGILTGKSIFSLNDH